MKYNRKLLEEETLQKIKEDCHGHYREYLPVPEMVNIVASIMEEKYMQIINDTLRVLPFGNIFTHTPESIPDRVQDLAKALAEECYLREKWEACADNLIVYAKDYVAHLSDLGEIDHVDNKQIKLVEDVLEQYNRLKNEY